MRTKHIAHAAVVLGRAAATFALLVCSASCGSNGFGAAAESDRTGASGPQAATRAEDNSGAPMRGVATFTAADVARIVLVLEHGSVAQARLAEEHGSTLEVKTYAARIVRERTEAMARLTAILDRTFPRSVDPTPTVVERELTRTREGLLSESTGFELTFMTSEVGAHARILGLLEASFMPSASEASIQTGSDTRDLEDELATLREEVASQIVHALRVQGVLRAGNAPFGETTDVSGPAGDDGPPTAAAVPQ
jgi:predicted outer membrane protein